MIVSIERDGLTIKVNGVECPVNKQEAKGPNKEVVNIKKVVGPQYQEWISLSRLKEGLQEIELKPHKEVVLSAKYTLTKEEQEEIDSLQAKIDKIIEDAKKRYVPTSINLKCDPTKMTLEQRRAKIEEIKKFMGVEDWGPHYLQS